MTDNPIRIGVIGAGAIGGLHADNLAHRTIGADVVAVMDIDPARAESVADACAARAYTDAHTLIADSGAEALLIATPDATHAELTLAAIDARLPVLCEKPLATSVQDARAIVDAELRAGRRLAQVGFMRQFDPAHCAVKALLDSGELGAALRFRGIHMNPRRGDVVSSIDSAIVNSLIHDMHSLRWMMDAEATSAYAQWLPDSAEEPRSARFAIVQLALDTGALATLEWSGASGYGYEVAVEIAGERATAQTHSHRSPILRGGAGLSQAITPDWPQRFAEAYRIELQEWVDSARLDAPVGPSAWDGYMSLVIADACLRSVDSGMPEPVPQPERPALYA